MTDRPASPSSIPFGRGYARGTPPNAHRPGTKLTKTFYNNGRELATAAGRNPLRRLHVAVHGAQIFLTAMVWRRLRRFRATRQRDRVWSGLGSDSQKPRLRVQGLREDGSVLKQLSRKPPVHPPRDEVHAISWRRWSHDSDGGQSCSCSPATILTRKARPIHSDASSGR